ncbi:MAG TPA: hypothetical protein VLC09_17525 [Polyangiaceae bacterium]|nr:hypothetical protein [Polyangiaceae bacterium]
MSAARPLGSTSSSSAEAPSWPLARRLPLAFLLATILLGLGAAGGEGGARDALVTWALPVWALGVFWSSSLLELGPRELALVRFGLDRRAYLARRLAMRLVLAMLGGALLALISEPAESELLAACLAGVLGSWALGGWFTAAAALGGRRGGWIAWALDFALSSGPPAIAACVPSGHLRSWLELGEGLGPRPLSLLVLFSMGLLPTLLVASTQRR